jgi:hypothetical protein
MIMKIYWNEKINDYVFQGIFEDSPKDYHEMGFCKVAYWIYINKFFSRDLKFVGNVK